MNFFQRPCYSYTIRKLSPQISHLITYSSHNVYKLPSIFQRNATSTAAKFKTQAPPIYKFIVGTTSIIGAIFFIEYYFDSRAAIHKYLIMPVLRISTTPESSQKFAIWISKWVLNAKDKLLDDEQLSVE